MSGKKSTTDAIEILRRRYIDGDAERLASLKEERLHARVARRIYDLRTRAGLTQAELAARVDTTQSAISRLEDADYEGHSLSMLRRIAEALGARMDVNLGEEPGTVTPYVFRTFMQFLRREQGLTLDELARQTKIPRRDLAAIEQEEGYRPSSRTMDQLSRFYQLSPVKLAALAGASAQPADEVREPVHRFAARSESFSKLSREERRALEELAAVLRE